MASSFIEDILGSEVDEKAVSAFVGSLESQLASSTEGRSSVANTIGTLVHSQQVNQLSSSPNNSSQSIKNSSVASVINVNTSTASPSIAGKSSYNNNLSSITATPVNIAPRPIVTSGVSLVPKTVTLLPAPSGNRGYLPVQPSGLGLPLMMGQVRGQLPHSPRLVSTSMSIPRTNSPQNTVHKLSPQIHSTQQAGSPAQRIAIIKQEAEPQPALINNTIRMHAPMAGKPIQNHGIAIKSEPSKMVGNHVPHNAIVKSEAPTTVQQNNMAPAAQSRVTSQAQVNRVKEQVMKLQSFFTRLITLARDQSPEIGNAVQELIKAVMVSQGLV